MVNQANDESPFPALKGFASLVAERVLGEPFVYDDLVKNGVDVFLTDFLRGVPNDRSNKELIPFNCCHAHGGRQ